MTIPSYWWIILAYMAGMFITALLVWFTLKFSDADPSHWSPLAWLIVLFWPMGLPTLILIFVGIGVYIFIQLGRGKIAPKR